MRGERRVRIGHALAAGVATQGLRLAFAARNCSRRDRGKKGSGAAEPRANDAGEPRVPVRAAPGSSEQTADDTILATGMHGVLLFREKGEHRSPAGKRVPRSGGNETGGRAARPS